MEDLHLPIRTILDELGFKYTVLSGDPNTAPLVSNVTVGEVRDVAGFLSGGELILTTFQAFQDDPAKIETFLKSLIKKKAAGVFVKLGRFVDAVPKSALSLAAKHDLLIVEVPSSVRWTMLIKQVLDMAGDASYKELLNLESIRKRLTDTLIYGSGWSAFMNELEALTNCPVAIADKFGNLVARSRSFKDDNDDRLQEVPIKWKTKPWGSLLYAPTYDPEATDNEQKLDENILNKFREAAAIAEVQISRDRVELETQTRIRSELLADLKSGAHPEKVLKELKGFKFDPYYGCRLVAFKLLSDDTDGRRKGAIPPEARREEINGSFQYMLGSKLDEMAVEHFMLTSGSLIYVILSPALGRTNTPDKKDLSLDESLHRYVSELIQHFEGYVRARSSIPFITATSTYFEDLTRSQLAFAEVDRKLEVKELLLDKQLSPGAVEIYSFLTGVKYLNRDLLTELQIPLQPVVRYDKAHDTELLQTLIEYFDQNENIPLTGNALHAHRHTVRYRLRKIEELTGLDLGRSEDKLRAQLALYAQDLLS